MTAKERVVGIAGELFGRQGARGVTMDQIAQRAGMSKRTLYELFHSKDELLQACLEHAIARQREAHGEIIGRSPSAIHTVVGILWYGLNQLKQHNPAFADEIFRYYPKIWESLVRSNQEHKHRLIVQTLERGVSEGVFRADIHLRVVAKILLEQINLLANPTVFPAGEYPRAELFKSMILNFTRGIATPRGLDTLEQLLAQAPEPGSDTATY